MHDTTFSLVFPEYVVVLGISFSCLLFFIRVVDIYLLLLSLSLFFFNLFVRFATLGIKETTKFESIYFEETRLID